MSDPKVLNAPERIWLVDDECGWQEARAKGNGVEYIRADHIVALEAEVERLRARVRELEEALRTIHARTDGKWDQAALRDYGDMDCLEDDVRRIARTALAGEGDEHD